MGTRLRSMDVTIRGVTKTYEFNPPEPVSYDDAGEASLELLGDAETTEVDLVSTNIDSATVAVNFTVSYESYVEVDLTDLEDVEDIQTIIMMVEQGDFADVADAIETDLLNISGGEHVRIDNVDVDSIYDEDGESIDPSEL